MCKVMYVHVHVVVCIGIAFLIREGEQQMSTLLYNVHIIVALVFLIVVG